MNITKHLYILSILISLYGCGRSFSPLDFGRSVKTVEDCLKHCSDYSSATYFVVKSSTCYCIVDKPEINGDTNDCRKECAKATYTPCSSGRSALVFTFMKDFNKEISNTYIKKECIITTNKNKTRFAVSDCNAKHVYGCTNTSSKIIPKSWYDYQEICLKWGYYVLYNRSTKGGANADILWTPIFRSHTVVTAAIAVILFVIFLLFLIVIISIKSFRRIRIYQEKLKRVNERLPGTEFSNYTGIEETNAGVNDSGYKELSDNVSQLRENRHEREMDKSEDTVDCQGYQLVPEQHYHTISEVEVHYTAADVAERNSDKLRFDGDDYLDPVI